MPCMSCMVKQTKTKKAALLLVIVGDENALNVSLQAHSQLLHLKQNEKDIWIAPMIDVAEYIKNYQSGKK